MSEELKVETCESPPPAPEPPKREADPRDELHELARTLSRAYNSSLMVKYLRLRRAMRQWQ
jgi:hypothetical protein